MLLIISEDKHRAEDLSDMFNFMGILSISVSPEESPFEISDVYRGIIIISPEKIKECEELFQMISSYAETVPIFSLGKRDKKTNNEFQLSENLSAAEIFESVRKTCENYGFSLPGEYRLSFLNVSQDIKEPTFFSEKLPLTKTELMIVRVLANRFPKAAKTDEILKFAFRKKRSPDDASIRTHISKINKKAMKISGRKLIFNVEKNGYRLFEKEISESFMTR